MSEKEIVEDEDNYRRKVGSISGRSQSPTKSKRIRQNEEINEKELICEFESNSNKKLNLKEKSEGSKELDNLYASYLPSSDYYERSFMHRDIVTHIIVTKTDFLITGSQDG